MKHQKMIVSNTLIALTALYILANPVNVKAATPTQAPLWEQVASRLGIGTEKVQTAFEQIRQERQKAHLDQLVKDGKITQSQADALFKKQADWQARLGAIKKEREDWLKSQGIDSSLFGLGQGKGMGGGRGMGMGRGHMR